METLESYHQRRTGTECSPSAQFFRASLECEGQKQTPFFVLWVVDELIYLCTFGKKCVFVPNPYTHQLNTRYSCGMDGAWLSILCFTADLTLLLCPRSTCINFTWRTDGGTVEKLVEQAKVFYLLCLKLSDSRLVLCSGKSCWDMFFCVMEATEFLQNFYSLWNKSFAVFHLLMHSFMYFEKKKFSEGM